MRRTLGALGLVILAACGRDATTFGDDHTTTKTTVAELIADRTGYTGSDLGAKELALTFDDGPGPMAVSGALAEWLHERPVPIQATFFVNGACIQKTSLSSSPKNASCGDPTTNATAVLAKEVAEGHYIGNHTTTHRDLVTQVFANDGAAGVVQELTETDGLIATYLQTNRMFFRAPYGSYDANSFDALKNSPMGKYVGPIYWTEGGGPTDTSRAADWECWQTYGLTTRQCGDRYLNEIATLGKRGIILMHDASGNTNNHDLDNGVGNTFDMVKYIVPQLEAQGFAFKRLDQVPAIAAALPSCDSSCAECTGPTAHDCTACASGEHVEGGRCVAGVPEVDAGVREDGGTASEPPPEHEGPTDSGPASTEPPPASSGNDVAPPPEVSSGAPAAKPVKHDGGCNTSGSSSETSSMALVALGYLALRRAKRRA